MVTKEDFDGIFDHVCGRLKKTGRVESTSIEFAGLTSDVDRVTLARGLLVDLQYKFPVRIEEVKSSEGSSRCRDAGNKAYESKDLVKALEMYTSGVKLAPRGSSELGLAHANRSAVLFQMGEYGPCLNDIGAALGSDYPQHLVYKLLDRKAKCLMATLAYPEALKCLTEAMESAKVSNLNPKKKKAFLQELRDRMKQCENKMKDTVAAGVDRKCIFPPPLPPFTGTVNKMVPSVSDSVRLDHNPVRGRHLVAAKDIRPGDVVLIEKPYVSTLLVEHFNTHCQYCFQRCLGPIPCKTCAVALFCSESCRVKALNSFHRLECPVMCSLMASGMGRMAQLSYRLITGTGEEYLKHMYAHPETMLEDDGVYRSDDYKSVYDLMGHSEKRAVSDLFKRALMACYMLDILERSTFFTLEDPEDFRVFVGSLFLRHLQSLPCNAHEVSDLVIVDKDVNGSLSCEIGCGTYPVISMMNHSCDPNVTRYFHSDVAVVQAIQTIKIGEEIVDNYGYHFAVDTKEERQSSLKRQYFFPCTCEACEESWPMFHDLSDKIRIKCSGCSALMKRNNCDSCGYQMDVQFIKQMLETQRDQFNTILLEKIQQGNLDALPFLLQHLEMLERYSPRPCREYSSCQEAVKKCFAMQGNCYWR